MSTKKASNRIFYTAPRNWKIWAWIWSPFAIVAFSLTVMLTIAFQYAP